MTSLSSSPAALIATTLILYIVYGIIWRLFLSPIARFPGPKLAAITQLYEGYYDVVKGGQYVFKIRELHKKYGPIIRINPWEIHINDPEFYDDIYAGAGHKRERYSFFTNALEPNAAFTTISHDLHRQRRAPLSIFFSKASIKALEPFIQERIDKLVEVLQEKQKEGKRVTISSAFTCLTNDIVCEYCFAKTSSHVENAAGRDFKNEFQESMEGMMQNIHLAKWIPWMLKLMQRFPDKVVLSINPGMLSMITFRKEMESHVNAIINNQNTNHKNVSHRTIFHEILSSGLPPHEKQLSRLWPEGSIIVGAGTDTTAWTLSVLTYHVLSNAKIRIRLLQELRAEFAAKNGRPRLQDLEQLPYLDAVISESLRLSFGLASHAQRVAPDEVMKYKDWVIPIGTPTSMTSVLLLTNPETFPDPHTFNPSRWLDPPPAHLKHPLSHYLISFSRGTRQCLGMNLAYAELFLCASYLMMAFPTMQLHDTCADDVRIWADCFMPKSSGKGVKIML